MIWTATPSAKPSPGPPPSPSSKNFLMFEAVRAESLGAYGHPITKTPAFERLRSHAFELSSVVAAATPIVQ